MFPGSAKQPGERGALKLELQRCGWLKSLSLYCTHCPPDLRKGTCFTSE